MLWPDIQVGFEILVISIIGHLLPGNKYNETCFILAWEMTVNNISLGNDRKQEETLYYWTGI